MQNKLRAASRDTLNLLIQIQRIPLFQHFRLALSQIPFHGKRRLRKIQCGLVIGHGNPVSLFAVKNLSVKKGFCCFNIILDGRFQGIQTIKLLFITNFMAKHHLNIFAVNILIEIQ